MAVPAQQTKIAVLLSPARLRTAAQGLVQLEAVARGLVGVVPLPVGAARLQEEVSPAVSSVTHAPPDAAEAPASTSQRALGVAEASPVASLSRILLVSREFRAPLSSLSLSLLQPPIRSGCFLCWFPLPLLCY